MPNNRWLTKGKCGKSERQKETEIGESCCTDYNATIAETVTNTDNKEKRKIARGM